MEQVPEKITDLAKPKRKDKRENDLKHHVFVGVRLLFWGFFFWGGRDRFQTHNPQYWRWFWEMRFGRGLDSVFHKITLTYIYIYIEG